MNLGQLAYETYVKAVNGRSLVSGQPLPAWNTLTAEMQAAWTTTAETVALVFANDESKAVDVTMAQERTKAQQ